MSAMEAVQEYTTGSVTSKDGTVIGYRKMGSGPALILVHGGMQSSESFMKLAEALRDTFTVIVPDRRGRGMSGPYGEDFTARKAVEDMQSLLDETGARYVFGLSAGAVMSIESALRLPQIEKLALYEPPLKVDDQFPMYWVPDYEQALADGDMALAMMTVADGLGMGAGSIFGMLPRFVLRPMVTYLMNSQEKEAGPDGVTMRQLLPTIQYDLRLVTTMDHPVEAFKDIQADVLLLGGSKSASYLKRALNRLEEILPKVRRIEFAGLDHLAADNNGQPEVVAGELRVFFREA